jgi:hypothetical protein
MSRWGLVRLALLAAILWGQVAVAEACSCPKEYLQKKYGTISQIQPSVPLPPPLPPEKLQAPTAG